MPIIIDSFKQHDPAWHEAKLGKPSGSSMYKILSPTGKPSTQENEYIDDLCYERITGCQAEQYVSYEMRMGIENEPKGRLQYELINDVDVRQVALIYFDDKMEWLVSPDGLIGEDGMVELKWAKPRIQIRRLREGWNKNDHVPQLQSNLLAAGRKWIDRVSYHPGLDPVIDRYYRDEKYIATLKVELEAFCVKLDQVEAQLRGIA